MTPIRQMLSIGAAMMTLAASQPAGVPRSAKPAMKFKPTNWWCPANELSFLTGLDPLDDFREMPIPKAETPPRPDGARCLESPPSILTGGSRESSE